MEINLAVKTISRIRKKQQWRFWLDKAIIWGGLLLALVFMVIAGINLGVDRTNQKLQLKIKNSEERIKAQSKIESQQVYLASKLAAFSGLVKTHELHQAVAETVFALIPTGTSLKGFAVNESGIIALSGSVPDWPLLNQLLSNLNRRQSGQLAITQALVKEVNFSTDGLINFTIELTIAVPGGNL